MAKLLTGLALGGGGARGVAHIGVLQVLEREGVRIDRLAGSSAGAIIGSMYASKPDAKWVEKRFAEFLESGSFSALGTERMARRHADVDGMSPFGKRLQSHVAVNLSLLRQFAIPREKLNAAMEFLVPARRFEDLEIPLTICATEMQSGTPVIYESGDLIHALSNSASIPGILEPEVTSKSIIADGGVVMPMPVRPLREHVDFVIASEISKRDFPTIDEINIYSMIMRAEQVTQRSLAQLQAEHADFVFAPDVMDLHWSRFDHFEPLLANGIIEAQTKIDQLRTALRTATSPRARLQRWLAKQVHSGQPAA